MNTYTLKNKKSFLDIRRGLVPGHTPSPSRHKTPQVLKSLV